MMRKPMTVGAPPIWVTPTLLWRMLMRPKRVIVAATAIVIMALFFWALDWALGAITRALTGQGG